MSLDVNTDIKPEEVGPNTGLAEVEDIIAHNTQAAHMAKEVVGAVEVEKQESQGQDADPNSNFETRSGSSLLGRDGSAGSVLARAKGNPEAGVYGDLALEASSIGAAAKIVKTGFDVLSDMDPGKHGDMATMENFAMKKSKPESASAGNDLLDGTSKKARAIKTKHSFDLATKGDIAGSFLNRDSDVIKTWGDMGKNSQQLTKKLELVKAKSFALDQAAGNAIRHKAELGGQIYQAGQKFGMGSSVVAKLQKEMHIKPPNFDEPAADDGNTDWA